MPVMTFTQTIPYRRASAYGARHRAYVTVALHGPGQRPRIYTDVLVDTGADFLVLPNAAARAVGLDLSKGIPESVAGVTGTTTLYRLANCQVEVEGTFCVSVDVLFGDGVMPVLGMDAILAAMQVGFTDREWHYG